MREEGIKGAFESHFWEACDIAHIFGKSVEQSCPMEWQRIKTEVGESCVSQLSCLYGSAKTGIGI